MTKEEIEQAAKDNWDSINGQFINGLNPHAHNIGFIEGAKYAESENERLIKEIEDRVVECILDDIDFGYDLATIKGKIKSGSYVGNSPETFKENERLNQENKEIIRKLIAAETRIVQLKKENERLKAERWILCDDDMPEVDEAVWITNGYGWTALGCLVECEGGYCWAVTNGIIYEEDGKIVSECELDDDYDVVYWHRLPRSPKQSCPQCKTEYTKEELLTNEHCFKCGFEMKGF